MASSYPGGLDSFANPSPTDPLDSGTVPHAAQHANANDAIEAIQGELGVDPAGAFATVAARLEDLAPGGTLSLLSPLGVRWYITVAEDGSLSTSTTPPA
jgi:hypothetical protein